MSDATQTTMAPLSPAAATAVHTYCFLIAFCILAIVWGVRNVYHDQPSPIDLLVPIAMAVCMGTWSIIDARRRRHPIPMSAQAWFLLLAVIVVPGYVIWSRGWRGLGWVALHAVLWVVLVTVAFHLGGVIIHGEAWLPALGL